MSSLSIRKLPRKVEKALVREAKKEGKTKTEIVLEALEKRFGLSHESRRREKIRQFFGKMSPEDLKKFQEAIRPFSEIEKELWE